MRNRLISHRLILYWQVVINLALWYNEFTVNAEFDFLENAV